MSNIKKGTSWFTRYIKRNLGTSKLFEISKFVEKTLTDDFKIFTSEKEVYKVLDNIEKKYLYNLSIDELSDLKFYTGQDFRNINNTMRGKWNYQENGILTIEKKDLYHKLGEKIFDIIDKFPPLDMNIKVYRGVNLKAFNDYHINTLEELQYLEGEFIYEPGFSSTSLLRSNSFFSKKPEWGEKCNIEIEYYIPKNCQEGAVLLSDILSYSKAQLEYVINSGSLTKILSVELNPKRTKAYIKAILLPKIYWNKEELEQEYK